MKSRPMEPPAHLLVEPRAFGSGLQMLAVALFAVTAFTLQSATVAAQRPTLADQTLMADDGTVFTVSTGTLRVPEVRSSPTSDGRTIELAFVRIRRGETTSESAHVVLAGGPGDSGVALVTDLARHGGAITAALFDDDVIGIDQRGTGGSTPNLASPALYELPLDAAGSVEAWQPLMERVSRQVAAEMTARGVRLAAYNTRESADDVDAVRQALGYRSLTVWGRSYGSHLALATLRQYPGTVTRLVLINPEGPNHTWKLPSQVDAVLTRIAERAGIPTLPAEMRAVIDKLRQRPETVTVVHPQTRQPVAVTIGAFDVQWITAQALGDPRMLATLPAAYREMAAGRFASMAQIALTFRARLGVESAMKQVMDLSSGATANRRARIAREAPLAILGDAINFPGMALADAWGRPDLGDQFRRPVPSDVPTLILAGDLDPRTPLENATEIAATLPHSSVVVVENATHLFDVFGSDPIRRVLRQFLDGAKVDERVVLPPIPFQ